MDGQEGFRRAILEQPADQALPRIYSDWLEDQHDPSLVKQGELLRLLLTLKASLQVVDRSIHETRLQELLAEGIGSPLPVLRNSLGMTFALIPPGVFLMGSLKAEEGHTSDEGPRRAVQITRPFALGIHPVTQGQFQQIMGSNPSGFRRKVRQASEHPVESVSWDHAVTFCEGLSDVPEETQGHRVYRLPTEAEWEYACRAGTTTVFHQGPDLSSRQANFNGAHPYGSACQGPNLQRTSKVGSYTANAFGLHDMHGNVWEWCYDFFDPEFYARAPMEDPVNDEPRMSRVRRGGCWATEAKYCRSARRGQISPASTFNCIGFRVALSLS